MVWREPTNYVSDCYFCMTNIAEFTKKNKSTIMYSDCPSALKPVLHDAESPVGAKIKAVIFYSINNVHLLERKYSFDIYSYQNCLF